MSRLSGRRSGHKGQLTYVKHAGDEQEELSDHDIFEWRLDMTRRMEDITEVNQSVKQWWYSHTVFQIEFKAYINQGEGEPFPTLFNPGAFNQTQPATVKLWPDGDDFNRNYRVSGWLEKMVVEVGIGTPNIMTGAIRGTGNLILSWF